MLRTQAMRTPLHRAAVTPARTGLGPVGGRVGQQPTQPSRQCWPCCRASNNVVECTTTSGSSSSSSGATSPPLVAPSPRTAHQVHASTSTEERWSLASASSRLGAAPFLLTTTLAAAGLIGSGSAIDGPLSSASAIGILALIVAVHECGHFAAARCQGIHVTKFAIGFGPPLLKYQGETVEYSLRLIPLGGYVAFPEDDPDKLDENGDPVELLYPPDDPDLLNNRTIPERALVISAGVIANIIFAYTALLVQVETVGKAVTDYYPGVKIPVVSETSAGYRSGLRSGDVVLTMDGWKIPADASQVGEVVRRIRLSEGRDMQFTVQRDGTVVELPVTPDVMPNGDGRIGVQIFSNAFIDHVKASSPSDAFMIAGAEFKRLVTVVTDGLGKLFTNFTNVAGQLSGPVAIVAAGSDIARTDSAGLFQFCAIININLAAVNLLPLPALDGGYLALLALEAIRGGKKLPNDVEQGVMASGLLLLTALGAGLVVRDTLNLLPH